VLPSSENFSVPSRSPTSYPTTPFPFVNSSHGSQLLGLRGAIHNKNKMIPPGSVHRRLDVESEHGQTETATIVENHIRPTAIPEPIRGTKTSTDAGSMSVAAGTVGCSSANLETASEGTCSTTVPSTIYARLTSRTGVFSPRGQPNITIFKFLERSITPAQRSRWLTIMGPLQEQLTDYLRDSGEEYMPASLRATFIGKTEETAQLCILFLCLENQVRRARKFFRKRSTKRFCRPQDPGLHSFDAHVISAAPQELSGPVDVFMSNSNPNNANSGFYGKLIALVGTDIQEPSFATLGGMVTAKNKDGTSSIYGMTVGHALPSIMPTTAANIVAARAWDVEKFNHIGTVIPPCLSQLSSEDGRYFDWTLCTVASKAFNSLILPGAPEHPHNLQSSTINLDSLTEYESVIVMTGTTGPKQGRLSPLPAELLLVPGKKFVTTYTVTILDTGKPIRPQVKIEQRENSYINMTKTQK